MLVKRIKKNNLLIDGIIPNRKAFTTKMLNILYHHFEKNGNKFIIHISKILNDLEMDKNDTNNKNMVKQALKDLQEPILLKNIEYKKEKIEWIQAAFLTNVISYKNGKYNDLHITINKIIINGLKQKESFTPVELSISNKFKTKYGLEIYELFLRNKNFRKYTTTFNLEALNLKFNTNYKYMSNVIVRLENGLKEIKNITNTDIKIDYNKQEKLLKFFW